MHGQGGRRRTNLSGHGEEDVGIAAEEIAHREVDAADDLHSHHPQRRRLRRALRPHPSHRRCAPLRDPRAPPIYSHALWSRREKRPLVGEVHQRPPENLRKMSWIVCRTRDLSENAPAGQFTKWTCSQQEYSRDSVLVKQVKQSMSDPTRGQPDNTRAIEISLELCKLIKIFLNIFRRTVESWCYTFCNMRENFSSII